MNNKYLTWNRSLTMACTPEDCFESSIIKCLLLIIITLRLVKFTHICPKVFFSKGSSFSISCFSSPGIVRLGDIADLCEQIHKVPDRIYFDPVLYMCVCVFIPFMRVRAVRSTKGGHTHTHTSIPPHTHTHTCMNCSPTPSHAFHVP